MVTLTRTPAQVWADGTPPDRGEITQLQNEMVWAIGEVETDLAGRPTAAQVAAKADAAAVPGAATFADLATLQTQAGTPNHQNSRWMTVLRFDQGFGLALAARGLAGLRPATREEAVAGLLSSTFLSPATGLALVSNELRRLQQELVNTINPASGVAVAPGLDPLAYVAELEGAPSALEPLNSERLFTGARGRAARVNAGELVALSRLTLLEPGRRTVLRCRLRSTGSPAAPGASSVQFGVAWLDAGAEAASLTVQEQIVTSWAALTAGDGYVTAQAVVATAAAAGVTLVNAAAVYCRPFVRVLSGAPVELLALSAEDVTDSVLLADAAAGIDARVAALEARAPFVAQAPATGVNLNSLVAPGVWDVANPTNGPAGAATTVVVTVQEDGGNLIQTLDNAVGSVAARWWRLRSAGTWSPWVQVADRGYVDTAVQNLANSLVPPVDGWGSAVGVAAGASGLNALTLSGAYTYASTDAATPVAGQGGAVVVLRVSSTTVLQWAMPNTAPATIWSRRSTNSGGAWSTWSRHLGDTAVELTAADNLDALERSGLYFNPAAANTTGNNYPIASAGAVFNLRRAATNWTQRFTSFAGTVATAGGVRIFERSRGADAWSPWLEIFHQGSLLGPVSQSAGVPTGRVIERGSNANGEFVRFADGTQICTGARPAVGCTTVQGAMWMNDTLQTWTFPAVFAAAPVVSGGAGGTSRFLGLAVPSATSASYRVLSSFNDATLFAPSLVATGRWF